MALNPIYVMGKAVKGLYGCEQVHVARGLTAIFDQHSGRLKCMAVTLHAHECMMLVTDGWVIIQFSTW